MLFISWHVTSFPVFNVTPHYRSCLAVTLKKTKRRRMALENINPTIYQKSTEREITTDEEDDDIVDEIDSREVFGIL